MELEQIKNSLDPITKNKIIKGAWIAFWNSAIIYGLMALFDYMAGVKIADANMAALVAFAVQTGRNALKEYMAGQK